MSWEDYWEGSVALAGLGPSPAWALQSWALDSLQKGLDPEFISRGAADVLHNQQSKHRCHFGLRDHINWQRKHTWT